MTALYNQGIEAAQTGDWPKARAAFAEAFSLEPRHYQIAANLGRAEFMMGKYRDAAEHLSFFLRTAPPSVTPQDKARVQEMLDKALTRVGSLTVSVNMAGADVLVSGEMVGQSPLEGPIFVEPGRVSIEARRQGYTPAKTTVEAAAGASHKVPLEMTPEAPPQIPETKTNWKPWAVGISAGVAVVGAATGIGFWLGAKSQVDRYEEQKNIAVNRTTEGIQVCRPGSTLNQSECDAMEDARSKRSTYQTVANIGYVVGGVGAAAAVAMFVFWPAQGKKDSKALVVFPVGAAHQGGLSVLGRF
ncbi:MAG: PEGA domain-containing protein [Polyangiaceae bacterium]|nr:PEGA domain-containing protein [Polyangiaceae bacterium]